MSDQILIDDPRKCGMGDPQTCCIFLVCGAEEFECGRVIPSIGQMMYMRWLDGQTNAKRCPVDDAYPDCQVPIEVPDEQ